MDRNPTHHQSEVDCEMTHLVVYIYVFPRLPQSSRHLVERLSRGGSQLERFLLTLPRESATTIKDTDILPLGKMTWKGAAY